MRFSHKQYAQALFEAFHETTGRDHDKVIANFVEVLKANGDLREYEKIIDTFAEYDREQQGIKQVEVTTAHNLEPNRDLVHKLNELAGGKAEIKQKIDQGLIGGVVVKIDDTMIDGSIRHHLKQLKKDIIN